MRKVLTKDCKGCNMIELDDSWAYKSGRIEQGKVCRWGKSRKRKWLAKGPNSKKLTCNLKTRNA